MWLQTYDPRNCHSYIQGIVFINVYLNQEIMYVPMILQFNIKNYVCSKYSILYTIFEDFVIDIKIPI